MTDLIAAPPRRKARIGALIAGFVASIALVLGAAVPASAVTGTLLVNGSTSTPYATADGNYIVVSGSGWTANKSISVAVSNLSSTGGYSGTATDNTYGGVTTTASSAGAGTTISWAQVTTNASGAFSVRIRVSEDFTHWSGVPSTPAATDGPADCLNTGGSDNCGVVAIQYNPGAAPDVKVTPLRFN